MKIFIKFDFNTVCRKVLEDKLIEHNIKHKILGFGEIDILEKTGAATFAQ